LTATASRIVEAGLGAGASMSPYTALAPRMLVSRRFQQLKAELLTDSES